MKTIVAAGLQACLVATALVGLAMPSSAQVRIVQTNSGKSNNVHLIDPVTNRITGIATDATLSTIEVLNILLGSGNDRLTIAGTLNPAPEDDGDPSTNPNPYDRDTFPEAATPPGERHDQLTGLGRARRARSGAARRGPS